MKTLAQRRNLAVSVVCAVGLTLATASAASAATPISGLARLDGSIGHVGKADPFTDGARLDKRDPYTDGARSIQEARDTFTDGA